LSKTKGKEVDRREEGKPYTREVNNVNRVRTGGAKRSSNLKGYGGGKGGREVTEKKATLMQSGNGKVNQRQRKNLHKEPK